MRYYFLFINANYNIKLIFNRLKMTFEDALNLALKSLPKLNIDADPNLNDILLIAQTFKDFFNLQFNNKYISKDKVVEVVEIVEEKLRPFAISPVYRDNTALYFDIGNYCYKNRKRL